MGLWGKAKHYGRKAKERVKNIISPTREAIKNKNVISPTKTISPSAVSSSGLTSASKSTGQTGGGSAGSFSYSGGSGGGGSSYSGGNNNTPTTREEILSKVGVPSANIQQELQQKKIIQQQAITQGVMLEERQISTYTPRGSTQKIPVTKLFVVDDKGNKVRSASVEEEAYFKKKSSKTLTGSTKVKRSFFKNPVTTTKEYIKEKRREVGTDVLRSGGTGSPVQAIQSFGLGFGTLGIGTIESVMHPVKTGQALISFSKSVAKDPSIIGTMGKSAGRVIQEEPYFAVGYSAGAYGLAKLPKLVTKGVDLYRTKGKIPLKAKDIIAPEYFAGQKFPLVKKGQTAGQLLQEFSIKERFGVTRMRGFTSSEKAFAKTTLTGKGSSELPGVYQAPKVSPNFLRIAGGESSQKIFTFKLSDTLTPTITKIKPTGYSLMPGVKSAQINLASQPLAKSFFQNIAEKGKSYVPFIKTEKEAVIPFNTPLVKSGARFYIKFEGRRIPIMEFDALPSASQSGITKIGMTGKTISAGKVSSSYSSSVYKKGVISPTELMIGSSKIKKSGSGSSSYSPQKFSYSYVKPSTLPSPSSSYVLTSKRNLIKPSSKNYTPSSKKSSYIPISTSVSKLVSPSQSSYKPKKSSYRRPYSPSPSPSYPYAQSKTPMLYPQQPFKLQKPVSFMKQQQGQHPVFMRRFGKWKIVGYGSSPMQAVLIGKRYSQNTLGVSFSVPSFKGTKVRGYRTKRNTPQGTIFIEPKRQRLKRGTFEIPEIQAAKRKRRKKR